MNDTKTPLLEHIKLKNGDNIYLLGTAHVSAQSVEDVQNIAQMHQIDAMCIEIDEDRLANLKEAKRWKESDLLTLLKRKQGFLLLTNITLASYQKRIGQDTGGVAPGSEMTEAAKVAQELGIEPVLADRKVSITLRRVWRMSSLWQKMKLLASMLIGGADRPVDAQEIENLKNSDLLSQMMQELAKEFPSVKEVLIDERDIYLAHHIYHAKGRSRMAVVGAGHMQGIIARIKELEAGARFDIEALDQVPEPSALSKATPYVISVGLFAFIIITALNQGSKTQSIDVLLSWIMANSIPAFLCAIIALAHPLAMLVALLLAPLTAFIPMISVGLLAALVQAVVRKPRAGDFESMIEDFGKFRFYRNRVLHTLWVLFLVNLGGSLGTFWGIFNVANRI